MPKFGVTPKKETELLNRMARNAIIESDLEEKFIRSGGPGGQSVNRSSTCVYIKHTPSGLEVKMQKARSQALNRFYARRRLCELIEAQSDGSETPEQRKIDRLRRQKARRKRRNRKRDVESGDSDES
jgi:protein subunit release factor B